MLQNMLALAFELWTEHSMNGAIILITKTSPQKRRLIHFHYSICLVAGAGFVRDPNIRKQV